jgi:hypothetical protein
MVTVPFGRGPGHFIAGEANFWRARQHETLIAGQNLLAGTVVSRITASGKLTQLTPGASDGSQTPVGLLYRDIDATAEDKRVVLMARDFEADGQVVTWPTGITTPQKTAALTALAALGIVVR